MYGFSSTGVTIYYYFGLKFNDNTCCEVICKRRYNDNDMTTNKLPGMYFFFNYRYFMFLRIKRSIGWNMKIFFSEWFLDSTKEICSVLYAYSSFRLDLAKKLTPWAIFVLIWLIVVLKNHSLLFRKRLRICIIV
jgi:hypothetical protein